MPTSLFLQYLIEPISHWSLNQHFPSIAYTKKALKIKHLERLTDSVWFTQTIDLLESNLSSSSLGELSKKAYKEITTSSRRNKINLLTNELLGLHRQ